MIENLSSDSEKYRVWGLSILFWSAKTLLMVKIAFPSPQGKAIILETVVFSFAVTFMLIVLPVSTLCHFTLFLFEMWGSATPGNTQGFTSASELRVTCGGAWGPYGVLGI